MSDGVIIAAPPAAEFEEVKDFLSGIEYQASPEYAALTCDMKPELVELAKALLVTNWNCARAAKILYPAMNDTAARKRANRGANEHPSVKTLYEYFKTLSVKDARPVTTEEVRDTLVGMWRSGSIKDSKAYMDLTDRVIEFSGIEPPKPKLGGTDKERALARAREVIAELGPHRFAQPGVVH